MTNDPVAQGIIGRQPAKEDPPAAEGRPRVRLGVCCAQSATHIDLIIPQSLWM